MQASTTGTRLIADRFELGERLASGGMGEVYSGWDRRDARPVALKFLRSTVAVEPGAVERFAREGALLRALSHPNIVAVLAVVDEPGERCIVMEHVPGTLEQALAEQPRPPLERVLSLALDLSDALARAHRLGIVHRDLKPANVLITADGAPKLSDFGIASLRGATTPDLAAGAIMGSLPYLAPEGWDADRPDELWDIWAFGVVLYEMLAGRRPFVASHPGMLLAAISTHEPPNLRSVRPDVPRDLADTVHRMLAKNRDERVQSAREVGVVADRLLHRSHTPVVEPAGNRPGLLPGVLPRPSSALVGRTADIARLRSLITGGDARLLTLTGPGGCGKTRLALAVAEEVRPAFPDGVRFVDLTPVHDRALVLPALARALGIEEDLNRPLVELLVERLGATRCLLVLDNFEQVVTAGPDIAVLLSAAPGVVALVTSRFVLRVAGEMDFPVAPLPVPGLDVETLERVRDNDSVRLFVARARNVDAGFILDATNAAAVAQICRRLDGLPLAIELAASRSRVLPPQALLRELDRPLSILTTGALDRPVHQRTLRRTIEWSVDLLEARERTLFVRLSALMGSWTLDDAEAVVGDAGEGWDLPALVDGLQSLIEKSLLDVRTVDGDPRYSMLETLREFAREQLESAAERTPVLRRHAQRFVSVAELLSEALPTDQHARIVDQFVAAHPNFRAALAWAQTADPALMVTLAGTLGRFWYFAGYWTEALHWYERALARPGNASDEARAVILDEMGRLEMFLGEEHAALRHHGEAYALTGPTAPLAMRARVAEGYGEVLLKMGRVAEAMPILTSAAAVARRSGHEGRIAECLTTLGTACVGAGDLAGADSLLREASDRASRIGDRFVQTKIEYYLAGVALLQNDAGGCARHCEAGALFAEESGDAGWAAHMAEMRSRAHASALAWSDATRLMQESVRTYQQSGSRCCLPHGFESAARIRWERAVGASDAMDRAKAREHLLRAARWLGAGDAICRALDITLLPVERALAEQTVERVRGALGPEAFDAAWREGAAMSEEDVVREITSAG